MLVLESELHLFLITFVINDKHLLYILKQFCFSPKLHIDVGMFLTSNLF